MSAVVRIAVGSDHGGAALKNAVFEKLKSEFPSYSFEDFGGDEKISSDYPDMAFAVAENIRNGEFTFGMLFCGTGQGMAIAANKVAGARAVCVADSTVARLTREHNNANIVCVGGRITGVEVALDILRTFIKTEFLGERHKRRVDMIHDYEKG